MSFDSTIDQYDVPTSWRTILQAFYLEPFILHYRCTTVNILVANARVISCFRVELTKTFALAAFLPYSPFEAFFIVASFTVLG